MKKLKNLEYWLGYIATGGGIMGGGTNLLVSLNPKDRKHLELLRDDFEETRTVKDYTTINNKSGKTYT